MNTVQVIIERSAADGVMIDGIRWNVTAVDWTTACCGLVSAVIGLQPGTHRLSTVNGRPLTGSVFGYNNRSTYGCSLASVADASRLWTYDYLCAYHEQHIQTTTISTHTASSTVTMETSSAQPASVTSSLTSSDAVSSTSTAVAALSSNETVMTSSVTSQLNDATEVISSSTSVPMTQQSTTAVDSATTVLSTIDMLSTVSR